LGLWFPGKSTWVSAFLAGFVTRSASRPCEIIFIWRKWPPFPLVIPLPFPLGFCWTPTKYPSHQTPTFRLFQIWLRLLRFPSFGFPGCPLGSLVVFAPSFPRVSRLSFLSEPEVDCIFGLFGFLGCGRLTFFGECPFGFSPPRFSVFEIFIPSQEGLFAFSLIPSPMSICLTTKPFPFVA